MRDLLLMRGIPGSGKSTFIKNNNLEAYTICPDKIRLLFQSPIYNYKTGEKSISQKNDKEVWGFVNKLVEERMNRGEFIVIDAMNIDVSVWKKLAEKYRYRIWVKNFDISLEECINRNKNREEYKFVPEEVIVNAYNRISETVIPSYVKEIDGSFFDGIKSLNVDKYENIYVFGDIHGCFTPLKKFFEENHCSENNLYIFTGDYVDRGFENRETLEFLMNYSNSKNFMFIEGNHFWERYWSNEEIDKIKSKEFLINTVNQIKGIEKSKLREWCRHWIQMAYIEFNGVKYFITHAGFGFFPGEKELRYIPTHDMIKAGKYEDDVDAWWQNNEKEVVQIHGHRNFYGYAENAFKKSFNLNSAVEFGEPLRVMHISKEGYKFLHYENEMCKGRINPWKNGGETDNIALTNANRLKLTKDEAFVMELRKSPDIVEKTLKNGISSFNFKRDVFFSDKWNDLNKIARGLFIDSDCKIVARSYEKFFNFNEGDKNKLDFLEKKLKFPVSLYMKYNGFLGMMSYDKNINDLHFFSKSTDESDFAKWFKDIAISQFKRAGTLKEITEYLKKNNVTMVFEVIDPVNDPHIIEYEYKRVWLLDIIDNSIEFNKKSYSELCEIAKKFNMSVKKKEIVIYNFSDLEYNLVNSFPVIDPNSNFEGFVIEDANGYMFKYKMPFYNFWKKMRGIKLQIHKEKPFGKHKLNSEEKEVAEFMENNYSIEELGKISIVEIRKDFNRRKV